MSSYIPRPVESVMNDDNARALEVFKHQHQHHDSADSSLYAFDVDLALVEKRPVPGVVAFLDHKNPDDGVGFSEVIGYNHMRELGVPVFTVESHHPIKETPIEDQLFDISRYEFTQDVPHVPNDTHPGKTTCIETGLDWGDFFDWERNLRNQYSGRDRHGFDGRDR